MRRRVVLFDYGSGNLRSAERGLARAGADVTVTSDTDAALTADGLVIPGVGAFAACMHALVAAGGHKVVRERVDAGRPVLGVCVGMQILFERGLEHQADTEGLGVLPGRVERLHAPRVPHMGWNTVTVAPRSGLFRGETDAHFYFVHSYAAKPDRSRPTDEVTTARHGERFVAAVEQGPLAATQFHPEKSGDAGMHLLGNWLDTLD